MQPEWIDGVEMEKGQPAVRAQRQYLIQHLPPILILHLKRFSHDAHGAHKLSKPLRFDETLDGWWEMRVERDAYMYARSRCANAA